MNSKNLRHSEEIRLDLNVIVHRTSG